MKTIRTILATFGVTTLLYGLLAVITVRANFAFSGRSIYQLFQTTGFAALVLGVGCLLSFAIMTVALVAFRDEDKKHRNSLEDLDDDAFLESETVPYEDDGEEPDEAPEAEAEPWREKLKTIQKQALHDEEEAVPDLFGDDEETDEASARTSEADAAQTPRCAHCGAELDATSAFCPQCGKHI